MTTMSVSSSYTSSSSTLSSFSKSSFNLETITAAELEPIKLFLQTALQNRQRGQPQGYNVLVQQFRSKDDPEMLGKVVIALNSYISGILARPDIYQDLLTQIFSWNWKTEMSINMTIIQLIFHIVVTNATYLSSAFKLLVKAFIPENAVAVKDNPDTTRIELLKHVHDIIAKIIHQVPTGLSELLKIVTEFFPHKRFSVYIQTEYIQQLLTLCNAFPVLQGRILDIIIEKCLEMDVEIIIEDDGEVRLQRDVEYSTSLQDDGNNHLYEDINDVFDDNVFGSGLTARKFGAAATASASSAVAGCRTQTSHGASIPTEVAELAEKLDSILSQLIDYFHDYISKYQQQPTTPLTSTTTSTNSTSSPPSSPSSPELSRFYQQLIDLFQQRLLLTHKSKYVQFIFFYVASQSAEFRHLFTKKLLDIIFNIHESILIRQSAMMYLASYLSRATFLPNDVISEVISDLLRWAAAYVLHYQAQNINLKSTMKPSSSTSSLTSAANLDIADERHPHHFYHILLQAIQQRFQQQLLTDLVFPTSSSSVDNTSSSGNRYEYDEYGRLQLVHHKVLDHELFYVIIQSICYILCFYGAEMMKAQLQSTHLLHCWNLVFSSKFEPIRYVIKSIRTEFLKLAQIVGLLDSVCWELFPLEILYVDVSQGHQQTDLPPPAPLLLYQKKGGGRKLPSSHQMTSLLSERYEILSSSMALTSSSSKSNLYTSPNRGGLHSVSSNSNMFASLGPNTIESFFPFDPCLLMKIYYSIEKHYRPWNGVPGLDETQLYQSLLVVNGLVITATTTTTVSEVTHRNGMTSVMNKSSASINVEFQQEIFGEDIYDIDEEDDEDEDNEEEEEDDGEYYHSGSRSRNMPIKGSSTGHQHNQVAMSMSYTETNYSASVTSHGDEDHEDGYSSSYSMSVTSSIPREQVMLEIIQKSKNHSNHRN